MEVTRVFRCDGLYYRSGKHLSDLEEGEIFNLKRYITIGDISISLSHDGQLTSKGYPELIKFFGKIRIKDVLHHGNTGHLIIHTAQGDVYSAGYYNKACVFVALPPRRILESVEVIDCLRQQIVQATISGAFFIYTRGDTVEVIQLLDNSYHVNLTEVITGGISRIEGRIIHTRTGRILVVVMRVTSNSPPKAHPDFYILELSSSIRDISNLGNGLMILTPDGDLALMAVPSYFNRFKFQTVHSSRLSGVELVKFLNIRGVEILSQTADGKLFVTNLSKSK